MYSPHRVRTFENLDLLNTWNTVVTIRTICLKFKNCALRPQSVSVRFTRFSRCFWIVIHFASFSVIWTFSVRWHDDWWNERDLEGSHCGLTKCSLTETEEFHENDIIRPRFELSTSEYKSREYISLLCDSHNKHRPFPSTALAGLFCCGTQRIIS